MKRFLICSIACFFFAIGIKAQNSTVTFTIQDPTGQVFANGTMSYVIVPTGAYIFNGSPLSNSYYSPQTISLDSSGSGSITLPRNDFITPINSQWLFIACPNASAPCTSGKITINQASQNISSVINTVVPVIKIPISSVPRAYSDSEVQTTIASGGIYYNVTLAALRLWNGAAWTTIGAGGGGGVSVVTSTTGTLLVTNGTTTPDVEINYAHAGHWTASQTFDSAILTGLSGTSPVCPNGTGGALTTTGCSGGGGSGTVTTVSVATANGFQGTVANPTTTPAISVNVDGTHYLPTTTDETNWNGKGTGTVTTVSSSDSSLSVANPTTTPSVTVNVGHTNNWTAPQIFTNGGGTPDLVEIYNDATDGEGIYFKSGTGSPITGGLLNNSIGGSIWYSTKGLDICDLADCSSGDVTIDLAGTGAESPSPSLRLEKPSATTPFVITSPQGVWLGAQFETILSTPSYLQPSTTIASSSIINIGTTAPIIHITGTSAISTLTYTNATFPGYINTSIVWVIADAAWSTTTAGNINTAFTATPGQVYAFISDGTKWSILTSASGGGSGLPCSGTCTANTVGKFGSGGTSVTNSAISDNGTSVTITEPTTISPTGGVGGGYAYTEGTVSAGASGVDNLQAVSAIHRLEMNPNNTGATEVVGSSTTAATSGHIATYASNGYDIQDSGVILVADTTTTPPTTAVGAASGGIDTCSASASTITMTGLTTSMTVTFTPTSDTSSASGWNAGLYIRPWVSAANTVSYKVCNPTSGSLTPASITLNVSAR